MANNNEIAPILRELAEKLNSDQPEDTPKKNLAVDNAEQIAKSVGQSFYVWDIASDQVEWSRGFTKLVGLGASDDRHLTGRSFETLLDGSSKESRFGTIVSSGTRSPDGKSVPYLCTYKLKSTAEDKQDGVWIEDSGCWYPDDAGRPMRAEGIVRVVTERRNREEELRRKSDFDDQTGLPNRRTLEILVQSAIKDCQKEGSVSAFIILSIERLDMINDVYGFEIGDFVLRRAGELIREKLRAGDALCRFSGSKFGIVLKNCQPAEIYDAGQRLLGALSSEIMCTPGGHVSVNGIIGACFLPLHALTVNAAFQAAFTGMKRARRDSQNRIGVYLADRVEEEKIKKHAEFSTQVVQALETEKIRLAFQPVVDRDGKIAFHEALVRMKDEDGEFLSTQEFVTTIEYLGLIRTVDRKVLDMVLQTLRDYPDAKLSINVSNDTVLDPLWLSDLAAGLVTVENGGQRLIVEITESLAVVDLNETKRFVQNVKDLGCKIAIDDFGAGFTSFANLKYLPVDIIKIDGSFGLKIFENTDNQAFVKSLLSLGKSFERKVVVEWVEDPQSAEMLFEWGVDYLQGFEFGKAADELPWEKIVVEEPSNEDVLQVAQNIA